MPRYKQGAVVSISKEALVARNHDLVEILRLIENLSGGEEFPYAKIRGIIQTYLGDKKYHTSTTITFPCTLPEDSMNTTEFRPSEHGTSMSEMYGFTGPGRRSKYPWNDWTNGEIWEITQEEHFPDTTPQNFRLTLYQKASALGMKVKTRIQDDSIIFQFFKEESNRV